MRPTFKDLRLQESLERDGYVVGAFSTEDEVAALSDAFGRLGFAPGDPAMACHSSFQTYDAGYKAAVARAIDEHLGPSVERAMERQRCLPGSFIAKWPGERSGFGLHQDLALVDERLHSSVVLWLALDDVSVGNGQLWVVPGSHRWRPDPRGVQSFPFPFSRVAPRIVQELAVPLDVRRGETVAFYNSTLHFSPPNRSETVRRVALTQVIPAEAPNLHYFGDGWGAVDVYEITDDSFWIENNPFLLWRPPPGMRRTGHFRSTATPVTDAELDGLVASGAARPGVEGPGPPNTDYAWCHRCGTTDLDAYPPDPWVGNVTLLCRECERAEPDLAEAPVRGALDLERLVALADRGFVTVPVFDDELLQSVRAVYDGLGISDEPGPFATCNDLAPAAALELDRRLRTLLRPALRDLFPGHEAFLAGFVSKGARRGGAHPFHQDLTFTDERTARALLLWCPLVPVDADNGQLRVVPGSHLWTDGIRPGTEQDLPTAPFQDELERLSIAVDVEPGGALVYDPALIHGSGGNTSADPRPVLTIALVPRRAELRHFSVRPDGGLRGEAVDDAFYALQSVYGPGEGYPPAEVWTGPVTPAEIELHLRPAEVQVEPSARPRLGPAHGRRLLAPPPRRVLGDEGRDMRLRRDGFTTVPLLTGAEAAELRALYGHVHGWRGSGFEADLTNPDTAYRRVVSGVLARRLDERVGSLFTDHEPYLRNFLCKWPDEGSALNLHRDWMYVDEADGDHSYVVWIALSDVGVDDGPLQVLRHSHRLDRMLRGTDLTADWVDDEDYVRPRLLTVPARVGEAIVMDNALVHGSCANRSGVPRVVAAVGMRRRGRRLVYFRRRDDGRADRHDITPEFFLEHTPRALHGAPPNLPVDDVVAVGGPGRSTTDVTRMLRSSVLTNLDLLAPKLRRLAQASSRLRRTGAISS